MAGRPIMRQQHAKLDKVGEQAILDRIAAGISTRGLIKSLGIGSRAFYEWLDRIEGRRDRYQHARQLWAASIAEETLEIADSVTDASEAQAAKLKVETRRWLASRVDPTTWADQRAPLVSVTVNDSHRNALKDILDHQVIDQSNDDD